jgi:integrase
MAIRRHETSDGPRFDVEWRLPDRTKRRKTFQSERQARIYEPSIVTKSAAGEVVDPHAGRVTLSTVFRPWFASRQDLSPKVRRDYEDIWRLRIEPRFGGWHVTKIDHQSIQAWVNEMSASGLSPRTVRWVHSVLKMTLDFAIDEGQLLSRNPATRTKFPPPRQTAHTYLTTTEVAALAAACGAQGDVVFLLAYSGLRFGELVGLRVEDVDLAARRIRVRRSITQVGGKLIEGNPKSAAGRRSIPIPQRLLPILTDQIAGRPPGAPAITSPNGALLGLETGNAPRDGVRPSSKSTGRRCACTTCGIPTPRSPVEPALTCACCRRRWATHRSRSRPTSMPISTTTNSTWSRRHWTRDDRPSE